MLIDIHTHQSTGRQIELVNRTFGEHVENYFSIGIHPWDAKLMGGKIHELNEMASNIACLALGEIGLDNLKGPDLTLQKAVFIQQIEISEKLELPVILHCVRTWNELKQLKHKIKPKQQWIFHGFTKVSILDDVLREGLMISIGAAILNDISLQKEMIRIPIDRLFLESDDSLMPISSIYEKASELLQLPLSVLELQIEQNFKRIFTKWTIG